MSRTINNVLNIIGKFIGFGIWIYGALNDDNYKVLFGVMVVILFTTFEIKDAIKDLKEVSK